MAGIPFKVCVPSRNLKVGVVAQSLEHLQKVMKENFNLSQVSIALEDGTLICNEDYFNLLEPQTNLLVLQSSYSSSKEDINSLIVVW